MIIYICNANRYRSPTAEFLHRKHSVKPAISAGVYADDGLKIGDGAVEALLEIEDRARVESFANSFRSRNVDRLHISESDILVAMDETIYADLKRRFPKNSVMIIAPPKGIPDPALLGSKGPYLKTAKAINSALKKATWC